MHRDFSMGRGCGGAGRRSVLAAALIGATLGGAAVAADSKPTKPADAKPAAKPAEAPKPAAKKVAPRGEPMVVTSFAVSYEKKDLQPVPLTDLDKLEVPLWLTPSGWAGPVDEEPITRVKLADVAKLKEHRFHPSAIYRVNAEILNYLNSRGVAGVVVMPSPEDVDPVTQKDRRKDKGVLHLVIRVARVTQVRTLGAGERVPENERVNNPLHARILEKSPLQPKPAAGQANYIDKQALDDYIYRLNRMPGRRVDVAVTRADQPGGVGLDFLVNEAKPWQAYYQLSNTGTKSTNDWRNRFGLNYNQLTNHDDVLTLEYATSLDFDSTHAFIGSYESRLGDSDKLRWRVDGNWDEFKADEVGLSLGSFTGNDWSVGGSLIYNIAQWGPTFLDAVGGVRWQNVHITDPLSGTSATQDFFLPYAGLQLDRSTDVDSFHALATIEGNLAGVAGTQTDELVKLSRVEPDKSFIIFRYSAMYSTFLEPIFDRENWSAAKPGSATLAHEMVFLVHGQYSDGRLVPRFQDVAGGFYTVRGYDESLVAGDSSVIGTVEYRFHIPRSFDPMDPGSTPLFGRPFRFAPQNVYGSADWDLIFRAFTDVGFVTDNSPVVPTEQSQTLVGSGVGLEFIYKQNMSIRVDWAAALTDVQEAGVTLAPAGSNRFHFAFTFFF